MVFSSAAGAVLPCVPLSLGQGGCRWPGLGAFLLTGLPLQQVFFQYAACWLFPARPFASHYQPPSLHFPSPPSPPLFAGPAHPPQRCCLGSFPLACAPRPRLFLRVPSASASCRAPRLLFLPFPFGSRPPCRCASPPFFLRSGPLLFSLVSAVSVPGLSLPFCPGSASCAIPSLRLVPHSSFPLFAP